MRAFLALPVVAPALGQMESLSELLRAEVDGVRWAPVQTVHITLHFFGSIDDDSVARAVQELQPVFAAQAPIRLRLRGLGSFPSEARPRVLWCGVAGDTNALRDLDQRCAEALAAAGLPVEQRPFRPHCTLGRPRQPWSETARQRWRELAAQQPSTDGFIADVAVLYESVTGRCGARHHPRMTLPLGG
ncbi:MAG TPA: RNA 2',3'-cyclic phosphodiesterase [Candidatus Dormibacteraeota bacterium]|nr:RNA 2',3'-cyclic phosphodiesterase [Candidatus Dormibacteraeota bacterium]